MLRKRLLSAGGRTARRLVLHAVLGLAVLTNRAEADFLDCLVFISASLTYEDGRPEKSLGTGSGFVISKDGFVVTAKHVVPTEIPAGATLVMKGSLRSKDPPYKTLSLYQITTLGVDITLLRFDPNTQPSWEYLKVSSKKISDFRLGENVVAWGFALTEGLNRVDTKISSLTGPENTVQVGAGIVRGMSGGPVVDTSNNVVGVVTGGAKGEAALNYFTPILYANPLIRDIAEYADDQPAAAKGPASVREAIVKNYEINESRTIGALQSKPFSITKDAVAGRLITKANFVITNNSGISDISVAVADDKKSVTLKYVVKGSGTLIGNILTEQQ